MNAVMDVSEYLARTPTNKESARAAVEPYRDMTPAQRWQALEDLLKAVQGFLGDREPLRPKEDPPFWMRWKDPSVGRPR